MVTKFDEFFGVKKSNTVYVGIDPDCVKSGVALYKSAEGFLAELRNLAFFDLMEYLKYQQEKYANLMVVVEAGWLNKGNWHTRASDRSNKSAKIGAHVGENHEVGRKIVEMCKHLGIEHKLVVPTRRKLDADTFRKYTKWQGRTNQEQRDAAMLVYGS